MKTLREIFDSLDNRLIHKWNHYIEIYDRYFSKYRDTEVVILEIGVSQGGSIDMWKEYFGPKAKFYGIDINPRSVEFNEPNVEILIGRQEDRNFLRSVKQKIPKVDILIDDGGHTMIQQITTFEELFDHVKDDGIYLCEDVHTSYMFAYHGGYKKKDTFIEYTKNFIDSLHGWFSESKSKLDVNEFTRHVYSVHFYTNIVVIEKQNMAEPWDVQKGKETIGYGETGLDAQQEKLAVKVKRKMKELRKG